MLLPGRKAASTRAPAPAAVRAAIVEMFTVLARSPPVPTTSTAGPGTLIRTDVELLGTTRIAGQALRSLGSAEEPEDFMADYRGTGLSNNLLQIEVTGGSVPVVALPGPLAGARRSNNAAADTLPSADIATSAGSSTAAPAGTGTSVM